MISTSLLLTRSETEAYINQALTEKQHRIHTDLRGIQGFVSKIYYNP